MGEYEREKARRGRAGAKLIYLGCDGRVLVGEERVEEEKAVAVRRVFRPADDELRIECVCDGGVDGQRTQGAGDCERGRGLEGASMTIR